MSHLLRAYSVLKLLRFEANCSYSTHTYNFCNKKDKEKLDRPSVISLTNRVLGQNVHGTQLSSPRANNLTRRPNLRVDVSPVGCFSKADLFNIFQGDSLAMKIAFQMLLELSRSVFPARTDRSIDVNLSTGKEFSTKSNTPSPLPRHSKEIESEKEKDKEKEKEKEKDNTSGCCARFLSEALDLLEACPGSGQLSPSPRHIPRSPTQGPSLSDTLDLHPLYHVEVLQPNLHGLPPPTQTRTTGQIGAENKKLSSEFDGHLLRRELFGLQECSLRLSIMSGIINLSLMDLSSDESIERTAALCIQLINYSRPQGDVHLINALRLQSVLCARTNRIQEALDICDEIGILYVHAEHSREMMRVYGEDSGVLALLWAAAG